MTTFLWVYLALGAVMLILNLVALAFGQRDRGSIALAIGLGLPMYIWAIVLLARAG